MFLCVKTYNERNDPHGHRDDPRDEHDLREMAVGKLDAALGVALDAGELRRRVVGEVQRDAPLEFAYECVGELSVMAPRDVLANSEYGRLRLRLRASIA